MPPTTRGRAAGARNPSPASVRRPQAITSLQDQEAPRHRNWCVYGQSGVGKTVLAGTAPNALFLTTDVEGTESARMMGSSAKEIQVNTWEEFVEVAKWIRHGDARSEFDWIVVDTIDELEELCWQSQLVNDELKRASKYQPNKGDYPVVWRKIREELMGINRAPINTLYLAHLMHIDRETEDGEDTMTLAMPEMGSRKRGDLSSYFCAQMGLVGYMREVHSEEDGTQRHLMTRSSSRWIAKDRSTAFGAGIVGPTVPGMLAAIEAKAGATTTSTTSTTRRRARRATR